MALTLNHQTNDISPTSGGLKVSNAYTLPSADGTNGQVLTTNGSGVVSFATAGGGGASDPSPAGGNGGSGMVVIKYQFQG